MPNPQNWTGQSNRQVDVAENPSPEDARKLAAAARVIVVSMKETDLPSGPLVLLDALQMGKPVVVTDVNGTRDYLDSTNSLVEIVPAGSARLMAEAIQRLAKFPNCETNSQKPLVR